MKKDLHPTDYRLVVFQDTSSDFKILTRSTVAANETIKWEDGQEYPLVKVHVSSASHPFFTGEEKIMDIEGRVDKFKARAEAAAKAKEAKLAASKKTEKKPAKKAEKPKEVTEEVAPEAEATEK
jgi:large subunit ribosomal protein L31